MELRVFLILGILLFTLSSFHAPSTEGKGNLILKINNIKQAKGSIHIGFFDSEQNFIQDGKSRTEIFPIDQIGNLTLEIPDLPFGTYAIAVFHDLNDNKDLDKNLVGIPKEPYAFSKPPLSKWRAPTFEEVKIDFLETDMEISLQLEKWKL